MSDSAATLTIAELQRQLRAGERSPAEAVSDVVAAIGERDAGIGGYLSHDAEAALAEAGRADVSLPLGGVPIAIKDLINVRGQPCSCASRILDGGYTSTYDATVIARLRAAGAIPLGRTNMDEFAMGSSTETCAWGPADPQPLGISDRVPGGSSAADRRPWSARGHCRPPGPRLRDGRLGAPARRRSRGCHGLKPIVGPRELALRSRGVRELDARPGLVRSTQDGSSRIAALLFTERDQPATIRWTQRLSPRSP